MNLPSLATIDDGLPISRRTALAGLGAAALGLGVTRSEGQTPSPARSQPGLVIYDCAIRRRWLRERDPKVDLFEPLTFLKHCRELGAGGMQANLGVLDRDRVRALRDFAGEHGLFIDGIVSPPRDQGDLARFEAEMRTASEVGALAVRTVVMPGRRYEQFRSLAEFRDAAGRAQRILELARPIVERHRVRLAVENHKDQRIDERIALYRRLGSEFIGACLDTGNNVALLEDPYAVVDALAPHAFTVHFKDQALREYEDGFLLGDLPLGQGCFDLPRMAGALRRAKPGIRFVLELLTRDALRVPCLTDAYWTTMPTVSGSELARTLRMVRHATKEVQQVSTLPLEKQLALEDANLAASLRYARERLDR